MYELFQAGDLGRLMQFAESPDSFEDLPWCYLYRELDTHFPGSKFILTVRKTDRAWFDSFRKHNVRLNNNIYIPPKGTAFEETMAIYHNHNAAVREYFKDRPNDLIELCWERGDGWKELCTFLDKPIPELPFPHSNRTPLKSTLRFFNMYIREKFTRGG
jgi:hypothetical protein